MATSTPPQLRQNPILGFDAAYNSLFGHLHKELNDWTINRMRFIFDSLFPDGNDDKNYKLKRVSCLQCSEDGPRSSIGGEAPVVMETWSEYNLMKSLELLGDDYWNGEEYEDAYNCYNFAHAYYVGRFGSGFVKSRDIKRKMGRVLIHRGQFEDAFRELRIDAGIEAYGTLLEAQATLSIKDSFGRSLLALELYEESVPYLAQDYLGRMNQEIRDNKEMLFSVIVLVLEYLEKDKIEFAMCMGKRLLNVFSEKLLRSECPAIVLSFAVSFTRILQEKQKEEHLLDFYNTASGIQSSPATSDTILLVSCMAIISFQVKLHPKDLRKNVALVYRNMLSLFNENDKLTLNKIIFTSGFIFALIEMDEAVDLLLCTYNKFIEILDDNEPIIEYLQTLIMKKINPTQRIVT